MQKNCNAVLEWLLQVVARLRPLHLVLIVLMVSVNAKAQCILMVEYKAPLANADSVTVLGLLTIWGNGEGTARLRYDYNNADYLIELDLIDSVPASVAKSKVNEKLLVATNTKTLMGAEEHVVSSPVFMFFRNPGNTTSFYNLNGILYLDATNKATPLVLRAQKTFEYKTITPEIIGQFYTADESYYQNLFAVETRGLSAVEKNAKLYLIVVAHTLDASIGASCRQDLINTTAFYKELCTTLDIPLIQRNVSGKGFSKRGVEQAIASIRASRPGKNDIVVFYYSGHGFRRDRNNSQFPFMSLRSSASQDRMNNALSVDDVNERLNALGARLTLVVSDCCNENVDTPPPQGPEVFTLKSAELPISIENVRALFFRPERRSIVVTSAAKDQLASGNPIIGGYFLHHLKATLETYTSKLKTDVNWVKLLVETSRSTKRQALGARCFELKIPCPQDPIFIVR